MDVAPSCYTAKMLMVAIVDAVAVAASSYTILMAARCLFIPTIRSIRQEQCRHVAAGVSL